MSVARWLSIPLLTIAVPAGFAVWAFSEGLRPLRTAGILASWLGCGLLLSDLLELAHPLLLAADGLGESSTLAWQALAAAEESWPVWSGWLALILLMVGSAVTFVRRLPCRVWRWLHAGLGIAVLVGLLHPVLLGIDEPVLPILERFRGKGSRQGFPCGRKSDSIPRRSGRRRRWASLMGWICESALCRPWRMGCRRERRRKCFRSV